MTTSKTSVAIVDDDAIYQFTAKRIIELSHLADDIRQFESGEDALSFITDNCDNRQNLPDILLLDLNMPVTDGWMFLDSYRQLKDKLCKDITIYVVTSSIDPRDIAHSREYAEVKGFISKPLEMGMIKEMLSKP